MLSFLKPSILDIVDILVVALLIYYFFRFIRGTRAAQMLLALLAIFVGSFLARWADLRTLTLIIDSLKAIWVVAFFIIFQPEIRNALTRLGRTRAFRFFSQSEEESAAVEELVQTAQLLKERGIGGLIVVERGVGLKEYIESGTRLEARVSAPLLASIFTPPSPLHDGACIIKGDLLAAAGCILPLADDPNLGEFLGLRHRAGLGITQVTDAVSIIVSEENGRISFAVRGKLLTNLSPQALRRNLSQALIKEA
jgi:diadenylate cyclase